MSLSRTTITILATIVALGWPSPSGTQDREARARAAALFRRGLEAFDRGEYGRAVEAYRESYRLRPVGATLLNLALSERALLRFGDAIEHLETLLRDHRDLAASVRRDARRELEDIRARVTELTVTVSPADATILVDGVEDRRRPLLLQAGRRLLEVRHPRYRTERREVSLMARTPATETFRLRPLRARAVLVVRSRPPSARLRIGSRGPDLRTPWRGALDPGRHELRLSRDGYEERTELVVLAAGQTRTLEVELDEEGSLLESPWLWIASGAAVVAATIVTVVLVASSGQELDGTFDPPIIEALRHR